MIYEELFIDGSVMIGKRRKDGLWDARTYAILKGLRNLAAESGRIVVFDPEDGSVTLTM